MTTYYVDGVDGNDSNAGTSEGSGNAWKTVGYAWTNTDVPDIVYVKNNATYTVTARFTFSAKTLASTSAPHQWIGYGTDLDDGGQAVLDGGSSLDYIIYGNESQNTKGGIFFANLIFQNTTSYPIRLWVSSSGNQNSILYNCIARDGGNIGIRGSANTTLIRCKGQNSREGIVNILETSFCHGCEVSGAAYTNPYNGQAFLHYCTTFDMTASANRGVLFGNDSIETREGGHSAVNCVFDGDGSTTGGGGHQINVVQGNGLLMNNIVTGYAGVWNFNATAATADNSKNACMMFINILRDTDVPRYVTGGEGPSNTWIGELVGDPLFVNEASFDYHLTEDSPAVLTGSDIGSALFGVNSKTDRGMFQSNFGLPAMAGPAHHHCAMMRGGGG